MKGKIYLLGFLIFFLMCRAPNDTKIETEETFTLKYELKGLINEDGELTDPEIKSVFLRTLTYFPKQDFSYYHYRLFRPHEFKDGVYIKVNTPVYFGCTREWEIGMAKDWDTTDVFIEWRIYHFPRDTINSYADSVFLIKWPEDTVKADSTFLF